MAAGIRVLNDWGTLQIDETYRNLFVRAKGTGGVIPVTASDLCALLPTSIATQDYNWGGAAVSTTKWWLFSLVMPSPSTFGLKVWDAAGQLIFDSNHQPLRIVDVVSAIDTGSKTYPAGRVYAVIRGTFAWKTLKESVKVGSLWTNTTTKYRMGMQVAGTTVSWGWYVWDVDGPWKGEDQSIGNSWTYSDNPSAFMVVDVTNY